METPSPERLEELAVLPPETRAVLLKKPLEERIEQQLIERYQDRALPIEQRLPAVWQLKARGWTLKRMAPVLGVSIRTLYRAVRVAREQGKLAPIEKQYEHEIDQLSADTIQEVLEAGGDRSVDVALEVARGRGHFKSHQAIKAETTHEGSLVLGLKLEVPEGTAPKPIGSGTIIAGTPRQLTPGDNHAESENDLRRGGAAPHATDEGNGSTPVGELPAKDSS